MVVGGMMNTKICSRCGREYPATTENFYRARNKPDGLQAYCKACKSAYDAERYRRMRDKSPRKTAPLSPDEKRRLQIRALVQRYGRR